MTHVFVADGNREERLAFRLLLLDLKMEVVGEAADWTTTLANAPTSPLNEINTKPIAGVNNISPAIIMADNIKDKSMSDMSTVNNILGHENYINYLSRFDRSDSSYFRLEKYGYPPGH